MKTVFVQLPDSIIGRTGESEEVLSRESQFLLALKLFELGRLNAKEAAAMCGINVVDFLLFAEKAVLPVRTGTPAEDSSANPAITPSPALRKTAAKDPAVGFVARSLG
jgi:hypothetical protein